MRGMNKNYSRYEKIFRAVYGASHRSGIYERYDAESLKEYEKV